MYTIYLCYYLHGDGGSSDDDDLDSQSSMNTANEINPCPLYNRYSQIQQGWKKQNSIVRSGVYNTLRGPSLSMYSLLVRLVFRIKTHIITCLLSDDFVIRLVSVASVFPRAELLFYVVTISRAEEPQLPRL
mmetsp:Transcript_17589/g.26303  ORF Transcript_17589/g.26303 Transcript_17589/m.26303 type:complete len:131 (+) Transcript_17589:80-472(+)